MRNTIFKMKQNIKLNHFKLSKFDEPNVIDESICLECVQDFLDSCKNVKLISYRLYSFDSITQMPSLKDEEPTPYHKVLECCESLMTDFARAIKPKNLRDAIMNSQKQDIKLNYFELCKFDQPGVIDQSICLECIQEYLDACKNVKLISYKQNPFDIPQKSKKVEEIIEMNCLGIPSETPNCIGIPLYHCVTLQDVDGTTYKRPYNCIFVLFVFGIVFGTYFYCFYRVYFS